MGMRELIDFARANFGPPAGLPQSDRPPLPPWLENRTGDHIHPIDPSDPLSIEGSPSPVTEPTHIDGWGIDVLAYYLPFHFYNSDWGIYLRTSGVVYVGTILNGRRLSRADSSIVDMGKQLLLDHERWHFLTELAAARAEAIARLPIYKTYFSHPGGAPHEEGLANAWAVRHSLRKATSSERRRVTDWMLKQGPGYRDFASWLSVLQFSQGKRGATSFMIEHLQPAQLVPAVSGQFIAIHDCGHVSLNPPIPPPWPAEFLFSEAARWNPPIYLVRDADIPWLRSVRSFPKFHGIVIEVHSNDHPPPHIHIQRPPGKQFTRYEWPTDRPLKGDPKLSGKAVRDFKAYLGKYGDAIGKRVEAVYGSITSRSGV